MILSHTPVCSILNSGHYSNEFSMFLNEFKHISVLDECFGSNSNLYRLELVYDGLSSCMIFCQLSFGIKIVVNFIS